MPNEENRLTPEQGLELLERAPVAELAGRAQAERIRRHGRRTYFTHSLNINPTNVCENRCELCAFWRERSAVDAYTMTLDDVRGRLEQARSDGLTDLHVVGGCDPKLDLAYYESLFRLAREVLPDTLVQGLTAVEVEYLARLHGLGVADVLGRLHAAGLGSLPGGGAEILRASVRARICAHKISGDAWLAVHRAAHALGMPTNATMLFGHVESAEDIVDHLDRLRRLQDETGGFQAFVPLPFHPEGTRLDVPFGPGGHRVVRVVALARLYLDNFPHVRALANYVDRKMLGVLAHSGADDVGPTSLDERIARAAGAPDARRMLGVDEMREFLSGLGLKPVLVSSAYREPGGASGAGAATHPPLRGPLQGGDRRAASGESNPLWGGVPDLSAIALAKAEGRGGSTSLVESALTAARSGRRLSTEQAVALHDHADLHELGRLAHHARFRMVPEPRVTFVLDRNISFTNICRSGCRFCAFHVAPGKPGGFVMSIDQIVDTVVDAAARGATQVLIQGGLNPDLDLAFYEEMLRAVKRRVNVWLHSLSPAEILFMSRRAGLGLSDTIKRLRAAGLDSLPGGGAEILVEAVRQEVSPHKISAAEWLEVMAAAQELGLKTTATMVYGLGESTEQRVEHLMRIRELQDRTGGFTAFIPWSFQPARTQLDRPRCSGLDYLRMVALARLVLDNVPHIQAGWVTEGPDLAQLALGYGADDFGGVLMEEKVVKATGIAHVITPDQIVALIRQTGLRPAQRTTLYDIVREF